MTASLNPKNLDGKTLKINYYCEEDVCLLVGRDENNNVYILHEELNRGEWFQWIESY